MLIFSRVYIIFLNFAPNTDNGCWLEQPRRGSSNQYQQSMFFCCFFSFNMKNNIYALVNPTFSNIKKKHENSKTKQTTCYSGKADEFNSLRW